MVGIIPLIRFIIYAFAGEGDGHIQSLVLGSSLTVGALVTVTILIVADLQRTNRVLIEDGLERIKRIQFDGTRSDAVVNAAPVVPPSIPPVDGRRDRATVQGD